MKYSWCIGHLVILVPEEEQLTCKGPHMKSCHKVGSNIKNHWVHPMSQRIFTSCMKYQRLRSYILRLTNSALFICTKILKAT